MCAPKNKRVYTIILEGMKTDPLLREFIRVHLALDKVIDKIEASPKARSKHLSWLRQAIPAFF
jgi:hypothetical protein